MADMALEKARGAKVKEFAQFERDEQTMVGEILKSMDPDLGSPTPAGGRRSGARKAAGDEAG
jgi:hypothetical protein